MELSDIKEHLNEVSKELFTIQAMLETASIALCHLQEEQEPARKAVTMSFVIEDIGKRCEELKGEIDEMGCKFG